MDTFKIISQNVSELAEANGYNQSEVSEALGILRNNYIARLNGKTKWSIPDIEAAAKLFKVNISDIFYPKAINIINATIDIAQDEYNCRAVIDEYTDENKKDEEKFLVAVQTGSSWKITPLSNLKFKKDFFIVKKLEISPAPNPGLRVAIIDDDIELAESLKTSLDQEGFSASAYYNAEDLIDDLRFKHFQAFIVDYDLVTTTGLELLKIIRISQSKDALAIMLTGQGHHHAEEIVAQLKK